MAKRKFSGQRPLRIAIRTIHIASVVLFFGAFLYGESPRASGMALVLSGAYLMADQVYRDGRDYFRYLSFWVIFIKILVFAFALYFREYMVLALWVVLALGSLVSHAPGSFRHYSIFGEKGPCAAIKTND
jgi:hypothetical protein